MTPLVSILMSVHNEPAEYLEVAVNSICRQSYYNIEFIIIDDASDDETYAHLENLQRQHNIIKLYRNERNLGLTATLNKGLALCRGEYIARMDADDYSLPDRIKKQIEYFGQHPDIDILGTGVVSFGKEVKFMSPVRGYSNAQVQSQLFFTSSLCHPSVMIRKAFLQKNGLQYDESVKKGQDYDLWERASVHGKLAVHTEVLLYYRVHSKQITSTNRKDQDSTADMIMRRRLQRLGITPTEREMICHKALKGQLTDVSIEEIKDWTKKLFYASWHISYIDSEVFGKNLKERLALYKIKCHKLPRYNDMLSVIRICLQRLRLKIELQKFSTVMLKLKHE